MRKIPVRAIVARALGIALLCSIGACQKNKNANAGASPAQGVSPAQSASPVQKWLPTPPITGAVTPALVAEQTDSFSHYLHFPAQPDERRRDSAVQFYCDIADDGVVETTDALIGNDQAFKAAVQTALDWGKFEPATVNGNPVGAYVAGTVLFLHDNGQPTIVVSLATYDRDRLAKMANYIQPQLIGGLRRVVEQTIVNLKQGLLFSGRAEVVVQVDQNGLVTGTTPVSESPKGGGLIDLLTMAVKSARYTPAYQDGKPVAGAINVIADFGQ